jgi:hypothetical protein
MLDRDPNRSSQEHPDDVVTASYLEGSLGGEARDRVEAHLALCADCRAGLALLALDRQPGQEPVSSDELAAFREAAKAPPRGRKARRARRWLLAAAAVAVAAIGVTWWLAPPGSRVPSLVERDGGAGPLHAVYPVAGSVVAAGDLAFRFTPVPGADRYLVKVADGSGRSLAAIESRAAGEPVAWPGDRPVPRGTLLWSVQALRLDRVLAETRPVAFECR